MNDIKFKQALNYARKAPGITIGFIIGYVKENGDSKLFVSGETDAMNALVKSFNEGMEEHNESSGWVK